MPDAEQRRKPEPPPAKARDATKKETPMERRERLRQAKAVRERRNQLMFALNCRGTTIEELAGTFKLSVAAVRKIIKAETTARWNTEQEEIELIRTLRLCLIRSHLQVWSGLAVIEANEAADLSKPTPDGKALKRMLQLIDQEARLMGLYLRSKTNRTTRPGW